MRTIEGNPRTRAAKHMEKNMFSPPKQKRASGENIFKETFPDADPISGTKNTPDDVQPSSTRICRRVHK